MIALKIFKTNDLDSLSTALQICKQKYNFKIIVGLW